MTDISGQPLNSTDRENQESVRTIEELAELRKELSSISRYNVSTMNFYASRSSEGFWHQPTNKQKASLSSTATCVSSLIRSGNWNADGRKWGTPRQIADRLIKEPWKSAGLARNNPFGLAFIAEAILDISTASPNDDVTTHEHVVRHRIAPLLLKEIASRRGPFKVPGSVGIPPYPPSAYLTQLVFRVLTRCYTHDDPAFAKVTAYVRDWSRSEVRRQMVLIDSEDRIADPMQLGYAIITLASATPDENLSPEEKALLRASIRQFFRQQRRDGSWPSSQPLFHYPKVGNAQCFEYELLTQLLLCNAIRDELVAYLGSFRRAVTRLQYTSFTLPTESDEVAIGWASGHHPQIAGPESWSTACVYDFVHSLGRLVAEAVRQALFRELSNNYSPPRLTKKSGIDAFATEFLDAKLKVGGNYESLRETLFVRFVAPVEAQREKVRRGGQLPGGTWMSAILFGPPGTSKTNLAEAIADYLGWPQLSVDPSYLVQDGMERLYARANKLFSMLAMAEEVVVLLDEFDEMGRDRTVTDDVLSRFITTAMLPKLAAINKSRKIVFLLATNYVNNFDAAFSRGGRFDMRVQIMPPSFEAKVGHPAWSTVITDALEKARPGEVKALEKIIEELTFLEMKDLVSDLTKGSSDPVAVIKDAGEKCTLNKPNGKLDGKEVKWRDTSLSDEKAIRV